MNQLNHIAKKWVGGLAMYQPGKPMEEVARELGLGDPDTIIKLASNENSLGPSPRAVAAMREHAARMHIYPDGDNYRLRQALAAKLGMDDSQLFIGHGSNEIIQLLGHVFLDPHTQVVVSDHAFIVYRLVAALYQAPVTSVPMRDFRHDLPAMARAINDQTRLVFISNPNNPTGTMVEDREIRAFMKDVPDHVAVVFDEAYIELLPDDRRPDTCAYVREDRNVFVLRTFSKTYGLAGLRIGYAIAPREGVNLLHRVRQPFNINAMAQAAALAALSDDAFVAQTRELIAEGLRRVGEALDGMGLSYVPSVANFLLVKVGNGRRVFEALQQRRIIVRPVDVYDLPEYVRVTIGTPEENEHLIAALAEVMAGEECRV
ncbi:MAG TPA: histidinol-phosphate transaminase [Kiritimatiellia bacterium]|nr:histidinol-phosphate transaminase [Kiritimatiellia bacterium]HMO98033.1 histidinol-phosphate transaminase [Kiritimatiellia bacterium]